VGNEVAVVEHGHLRGRRLHVRDDVGRQEDDTVAGGVRERAPNADAFLGVETDRRLVDDQQIRVVQQCLCDPGPLVHPAGERVEPAVADVLEVDEFQQFVRACAGGLAVQPAERGDVLQKLRQP